MDAGLPLALLSALAIVVVGMWALPAAPDRRARRVVGGVWLALLAACWAPTLMRDGTGSPGGGATAVAFLVALAGLFMPQLTRWIARRGRR
jgi:hypothetical protein